MMRIISSIYSMLILSLRSGWNFFTTYLNIYLHKIQPYNETATPVLNTKMRKGIISRFSLFGTIMLASFALIWAHIYKLQITRHGEFEIKGLKIYRSFENVLAQRGKIFDAHGNILACDVPSYDILVEPKRFAKKMEAVLRFAEVHLEMDRNVLVPKLYTALNHKFPCLAVENLCNEKAEELKKENLPALEFLPSEKKEGNYKVLFYPLGISKKETNEIIEKLVQCSGENKKDLLDRVNRALEKQREIPLKLNVPREMGKNFMFAVKSLKLSGIRAIESSQRAYPADMNLANMLGYLNHDKVGISGIEAMFNDIMTPTPGKIELRRDRRGRFVESGEVLLSPAQDGADVYLTINGILQQIVEEEMKVLVKEFAPDHAYAILMEPSSGAIKAVAQFPQFNPNDSKTMQAENLPNHALYKSYEPGSIMKGISIGLALENRVVNLESVFYCERGQWYYGGRRLRDTHPYSELTVAEIMQKSSNIGTAKIALDMGEEMLYKGLASFGFGRPSGLGFYPANGKKRIFRGESPGMFKHIKSWDTLTVTRMPIGQGLSATPWQMIQAWSALANNGIIMQPYIIDKIVYPDNTVQASIPRVKSVPLSREACALTVESLKLVTEQGGTGRRAAVEGYKVAGKTGTAQIWVPADPVKKIPGHYSNRKHFSSFVGFAPADNPAFILLVSAENPKGPFRTGGVVCGPTFSRIAKRSLEYLQIPADVEEEQDDSGTIVLNR